jgi:hypothetical protein
MNRDLESFIIQLVNQDSPYGITRRGIFYKSVSAGFYPGTHDKYYKALGPVIKRLRDSRKLDEEKILDGTRIRQTPYCFSDPGEFLTHVECDYRKDLWENQPAHLEVFSEKDAMSAVLSSVIDKYQITYNMIRGYSSDTLIYKVIKAWETIPEDKQIHVLYVGDHDPSGKNIETAIKHAITLKLRIRNIYKDDDVDFDVNRIVWKRLAAKLTDLDTFSGSLIPCKPTDKRTPAYKAKYGDRCLEVDAIDNVEIVSRLEKAILKRIDQTVWKESQELEAEEQEKLSKAISKISAKF